MRTSMTRAIWRPLGNRRGLHLQERQEQAQGQVVDAKIADIFQGAQHRGLPRTGQPGEDENGKRGQMAVVRFRVLTWFLRHFSLNLATKEPGGLSSIADENMRTQPQNSASRSAIKR